MSKISKYLQMNEKLLLEYTYDINATSDGIGHNVHVLESLDGELRYFEDLDDKGLKRGDFTTGVMFTSFPSKNSDEYFYIGSVANPNSDDAKVQDAAEKLSRTVSFGKYTMEKKVNSVVGDFVYSNQNGNIHNNAVQVPMETVRIYITTGYTFNDCLGFVLTVKADQGSGSTHKSKDNQVCLANFTFHKSVMPNLVKFASKPFYQQSRFYDRYIEFKIPSAYYLARHKSADKDSGTIFDVLNLDNGKTIHFNLATFDETNFDQTSWGETDYFDIFKSDINDYTDKILYNQGRIRLGKFANASVVLNSNADNFNLRLYEDVEANCFRYYPVWGVVTDDNPITRKIMNSIENGSIPLSLKGFLDDNDSDIEAFEEIYGETARKWIVVNQIEMELVYVPMISVNKEYDNEIVITRKFNYTEDFEEDNDNITTVDDIYKFAYRPIVESLGNGYVCEHINISYTGRLVNRLNGSEVIRTATLSIDDAEAKFGVRNQKINVNNLYTWKLFNKIESEVIDVQRGDSPSKRVKYITKFVTTNDFCMVDEDGNSNTQGNFVIRLYDTESVYKMRLFTTADKNEPFELGEANATFLLRVNLGTEGKAEYIPPTYSSNMNSIVGELEYKITEKQAKGILEGDRRWHLIAKTETGITTLFSGKFESAFE